jgi:hypothetical protein
VRALARAVSFNTTLKNLRFVSGEKSFLPLYPGPPHSLGQNGGITDGSVGDLVEMLLVNSTLERLE